MGRMGRRGTQRGSRRAPRSSLAPASLFRGTPSTHSTPFVFRRQPHLRALRTVPRPILGRNLHPLDTRTSMALKTELVGGFKKGFDPRRQVGRKRGSKNRPKTEAAYKCPYCYKPIGRVRERRGLTKAQIPDRLRQIQRRKKHEGQPRRGRLRFERGFDPARCLTGRLIGKPNSHPRVPPYCKHCHRRIERKWAKVLIRRWLSRQP